MIQRPDSPWLGSRGLAGRGFYLHCCLLLLAWGWAWVGVVPAASGHAAAMRAAHAPGQLVVRYRNPAAAAMDTKAAQDPRAKSLARLDLQFQLQRRRALTLPTAAPASGKESAAHTKAVAVARKAASRTEVLEFPADVDLSAAQAAYAADPSVERAEPNYLYTLGATPADPLYAQQRAAFEQVGLPTAWDLQTGQPGVLVAVIDSGCDRAHEDLAGRIASQAYDFITDSSDVTDDLGHGTRVCALIGAAANNGTGMAGAAHGVTLLPLDVVDPTGLILNSDVIAAVDYAIAQGADVINMSFTNAAYSQLLAEAIARARAEAVLVAAVGNEGRNDAPRYPAAYDGVIGVAASAAGSTARAGFSNYNGPHVTMADLAAPGEGLLSAFPGDLYDAVNGNGTSYAAPLVAAAAALLKSRYPWQSSLALTQHLLANAGTAARDYTACGFLDAAAALATPLQPRLRVLGVTVDDAAAYAPAVNNADGRLNNGESARLLVSLGNDGADGDTLVATLATTATVIGPIGQPTSSFGDIPSGGSFTNTTTPFGMLNVSTTASAQVVTCSLALSGGGGFSQTLSFDLPVDDEMAIAGVKVAYPFVASKTYHVTGNLMLRGATTIPPGTTFKVDPGVELRADTGCALTAVGTARQPIVFTSAQAYRPSSTAGPGLDDPSSLGPRTEPVNLAAYPQLRYVSATTGNDVPAAGTAENPWRTLPYALSQVGGASATNRHALLVAQGTYTFTDKQGVLLKNNVDLYGGFSAQDWSRDLTKYPTVLDGENARGALAAKALLNARPLVVDGFVITRCKVPVDGSSGISISFSSVAITLSNCDLRENLTPVCTADDSTITLRNCRVAANMGGVQWWAAEDRLRTLQILNCIISDNYSAPNGGDAGFTLFGRTCIVRNTLASGNMPAMNYDVGGLRVVGFVNTEVTDCELVGNGGIGLQFDGQAVKNVLELGSGAECILGGYEYSNVIVAENCRLSHVELSSASGRILKNCQMASLKRTGLSDGTQMINCTVEESVAWGALTSGEEMLAINCILPGMPDSIPGGDLSKLQAYHCDVYPNPWPGPGSGNLSTAPAFVGVVAWGQFLAAQREVGNTRMRLTLPSRRLAVDQLKHQVIHVNGERYAVASNTEDSITVWGDPTHDGDIDFPLAWEVRDYHLRAGSLLQHAGLGTADPTYGALVPLTDAESDPRLAASSDIGSDEYAAANVPAYPWGRLRIVAAAAGAQLAHVVVEGGTGLLNESANFSIADAVLQCNAAYGLSSTGTSTAATRLTARHNNGPGIQLETSATLSLAWAESNAGIGLSAGVLADCQSDNNGAAAIVGGHALRCTAAGNQGDGFVLTQGTVGCAAHDNRGHGIRATGGDVVDCEARDNDGVGILISGGGTASGSTSSGNLGEGIQTDGSTIEQCLVEKNYGVAILGSGSSAVNRCRILANANLAVSSVQTVTNSAIAGNAGAVSGATTLTGNYIVGNRGDGITGGAISDCSVVANSGKGINGLTSLVNAWVVRNGDLGVASSGGVGTVTHTTIQANRGGVLNLLAMEFCNLLNNGPAEATDSVTVGTDDRLMRNNYWGVANTLLLQAGSPYDPLPFLVDVQDGAGDHLIDVWPFATAAVPNAPSSATPAFLLGITPSVDEPANAQVTTFTLTFSEPMSATVAPVVTFDQAAPYTRNLITPVAGSDVLNGWIAPAVWQGVCPIDTLTGNGRHTLRVSGAVAADGFALPDDATAQFTVDTSGAAVANNGIATLIGAKAARVSFNRSLAPDTVGYKVVRTVHDNEAAYRDLSGVLPQGSAALVRFDDPTLNMPGAKYSYKVYRVTAAGSDLIWTGPLSVTTSQVPGAPLIEPIDDAMTSVGLRYVGPAPVLTQGTAPVTWSLAEAPQGMAISPETGEVTWPRVEYSKTPYTVTIRATNGLGSDEESWQLQTVKKNGVVPGGWVFYE